MSDSNAHSDKLLSNLFEEPVVRTVLPNGLTVVFLEEKSSPLISLQAWIKTGSIHEDGLLGSGVSHYLEHMLFKGSKTRTARDLTVEIESLGGQTNAYTSFDRTVYHIDAPSESGEKAVDILCDLVTGAALPRDEMDRERDVILREIDMCRDDPDRRIMQGLLETAYRKHPYRYPVIGYRELFEKLEPDELCGYYESRYFPDNIVLVGVGDMDASRFLDWVNATWGMISRRRISNPLIAGEPAQLAPRDLVLEGDVNLYRGAAAWKIPGLTHPDVPALNMLALILGSGDSSLLWQEIRERQNRVHSIDASAWTPMEGGGLFWLFYTADTEKGVPAKESIQNYLNKRMEEPFSPALLEKAKRRAMVSEINARKTMSGLAGRLGQAEVSAGDLNYPRHYFRRLLSLTPDDLTRVGQTYFREAGRTHASLAPRKEGGGTHGVAARKEHASPRFESILLDNGVRILHQKDSRLPKVHIRVVLRGGALYEPPGERGITRLLATLLTADTEKHTAKEVAERIESLGGQFTEFTGNNTFGLGIEVLSENLGTALELLDEALFLPRFEQRTFRLERDAQISEIEEALDDIVSLGRYHLREHFFGSHAFRRNSLGEIRHLKKISPESVRRYYRSLFLGSNVVVSVAGDFEDTALDELSVIFSKVPAGEFPIRDGAFTMPAETGRKGLEVPREQAVLFSAFPDVGITHPDYLAAEVLDACLSGMSSRLFQRVREEKGMAYFVTATRTIGVDCGLFSLHAGTHPDQVECVFEEFNHELERMRSGAFEDGELERCKMHLKSEKIMGMQTAGSRAMQAALNILYGLPLNDWLDYPARIQAIDEHALQSFAQTYLIDSRRLDLVLTRKQTGNMKDG